MLRLQNKIEHAWLFVVLLSISGSVVWGATIYVDRTNTGGPWDGLTPATAWETIMDGVTHLGVTNAVLQGGHTVLVNPGVYTNYIALTSAHSGVPGAPNVFLANGSVTIYDSRSPARENLNLDNADFITVDGFYLTHTLFTVAKIRNGSSDFTIQNCTVNPDINWGLDFSGAGSNCLVHRCVFYGFDTEDYAIQTRGPDVTIENCVITKSGYAVNAGATETIIRNCVVFGNSMRGVMRSGGKITALNNCFFGNGVNVYDNPSGGQYHSTAEINGFSEGGAVFASNIVANPGFSDLADDWNLSEFYSSSPCVGGATDGGDIGISTNPVVVAISSNTYYVTSSTGNDGRSAAMAQDRSTPWATISKAAAVAVAGDTVIVTTGTYTEAVMITNGGSYLAPLTYLAQGDVIVTNNKPFYLDRVAGVVLDGFKCVGGLGYGGNGVKLDYAPGNTVRNGACFINKYNFNNYPNSGIYLWRSPECIIEAMTLYDNNNGVFVSGSGRTTIDSCVIYSNSPYSDKNQNFGGVAFLSRTGFSSVQNCSIYDNLNNGVYSLDGGGLSNCVVNCVVGGSTAHGIHQENNTKVTVVNTVISSNAVGVWENAAGDDATIVYCCFDGNETNVWDEGSTALQTANEINGVVGNSNNIVAIPRFRTPATNDFRLQCGSPCVNAGTPSTELETDMFGNPRLAGPAVDIGVYEMPVAGSIFRFR